MREITYISAITIFSFLVLSKNPWATLPVLFFLIAFYIPYEKLKFLVIPSVLSSIFFFIIYIPTSLSGASGLMLSYLMVAEFLWRGSNSWKDWVHVSSILLMADSAIYSMGIPFFLLSLLFIILSLARAYRELYPHEEGKILSFLPIHLVAILIFAPLIFISIPRRGAYSFSGGYGRSSGLSDLVDLNFSGRIRESMAVAFEVRGNKIPHYWRSKVFYTYRNGKWLSGLRGKVKSEHKAIEGENIEGKGLEIKYYLKYPPLIPLPYGTEKVILRERVYWSFGDFFEFGGLVKKYRVILGKDNGKIYFLSSYGAKLMKIGEENPFFNHKRVRIYLNKDEENEIRKLSEKLRGSNLKNTLSKINEYFRENFLYSTDIKLISREPLYNFLFSTRKGHCELYATATSAILKFLGWDARLVTGFRLREFGDAWAIARMRDAHAWVEIWDGKKWISFDPSPGEEIFEYSNNPLVGTWEKINSFWERYIMEFSPTSQFNLYIWIKKNLRKIVLGMLFLLLAFIILSLIPKRTVKAKILPKIIKKYPWYYRKLLSIGKKLSINKSPYSTPMEFGRFFGKEGEFLIGFYYKERFGKIPLAEEEISLIREKVKEIENKFKEI